MKLESPNTHQRLQPRYSDMYPTSQILQSGGFGDYKDLSFFGVPQQEDLSALSYDRTSPSQPQLLPKHIDPSSMWIRPSGHGINANSTNLANPGPNVSFKEDLDAVLHRFGHITPPDDGLEDLQTNPRSHRSNSSEVVLSRKDSAMDGDVDHVPSPLAKKRKSSKPSLSRDDQVQYQGKDKREKYREKNRVAAAKCRAKKRDHVDILEDNYRTQGVLNSALKHSAQQLRDELSHLRTQALQHSFCNCLPIQDYNMRKAQNLAAENGFRTSMSISNAPEQRSISISTASSAVPSDTLSSPLEYHGSPTGFLFNTGRPDSFTFGSMQSHDHDSQMYTTGNASSKIA